MNHTQATLDILDRLVQCLRTKVSEAVAEGALGLDLCRVGVAPGVGIAYDFIGSGRCLDNKTDGQGFVVLTGAYPSVNFPNPVVTPIRCGAGDLALNINVGIIRTYPVLESGEPPSQEMTDSSVLGQITEMGLIEEVIGCCFTEDSDLDVLLGVYTPVGPDGGAVGGFWSVTIEGATD